MKILVIGPSWVGDMMMSQSLYRTLKAIMPDAQIDVMAPDWCRPLLSRMPEVTQALSMPIGHGSLALFQRRKLGVALRNQGYQRAIVTPNSFKSALVPYFARIPNRTGWRGEMRYHLLNDRRVLHKKAFPRMVERYTALAYEQHFYSADELPQPLLMPKLQVKQQDIEQVYHKFNLEYSRPLISFCPGAEFGPAKRWPHYHYASLAQELLDDGYNVVLLGSTNDHKIASDIVFALSPAQRNHCINLAGKTSLDEAVSLIAASCVVVTNDSGLMHVAAALNIPLIALYGPTSPEFTPPLSPKAKVIRLAEGYSKIRHGEEDDGYDQSLIDISPEQVLTEVRELL